MTNKRFRISEDCDFSGVYIILNLDNRKVYIGSTRNIRRRLTEHEIGLRENNHKNLEIQKDYNSGHCFIAYAITRIELLQENSFAKDDNLRFFEFKAIKCFDSDNPEKGYNKRADRKECREERKIEWSKRYIDDYFWNEEMSRNPKNENDIGYHKEEMKKFIEKALKNKL